jgi:sigma-B regulation protein RsbU (phosphoserine phosphatase)
MPGDLGHILVLDSDATRGELLGWQLADLGYTVSTAATVEAAIEAAAQGTVSLLIVDASLPLESLAQLHNTPHLLAIPILLIAGDESEIDARLAYVSDCLRRPFGPSLLKLRLGSLIKHNQIENDLRVERDLEIARDIQRGFLPQELPSLPGWEIATRFDPAYEVAGDFYDVFFLTNKTRLGFIVADVCDKGIGSALYMGLSRSLLRAFAQQNYTVNWADVLGGKGKRDTRAGKTGVGVTALSNAITITNNYIATNHGQSNMFATLFFGILNPENGAVSYVNAGHNPPLIIGANKQVKARLHNTSMPIGMFPDVEFGIEVAQLDPGDMLLAFTDGVTEAKNTADEQYTDERLEMLMTAAPDSAEALLAYVQADVKLHVGLAPQSDDITMLALRRVPDPSPE